MSAPFSVAIQVEAGAYGLVGKKGGYNWEGGGDVFAVGDEEAIAKGVLSFLRYERQKWEADQAQIVAEEQAKKAAAAEAATAKLKADLGTSGVRAVDFTDTADAATLEA